MYNSQKTDTMNTQQKYAAASAKLDEIQMQLDNLFNDCQTECQGMSTDEANKVFADKYKAKYDELDRLTDIVGRVYWYTDPQNSRHNKQINHRHTVARMHAAGLNKMSL